MRAPTGCRPTGGRTPSRPRSRRPRGRGRGRRPRGGRCPGRRERVAAPPLEPGTPRRWAGGDPPRGGQLPGTVSGQQVEQGGEHEGERAPGQAAVDRLAEGPGQRRGEQVRCHVEEGDDPVVERVDAGGDQEGDGAGGREGPAAPPGRQPDHRRGKPGHEDVEKLGRGAYQRHLQMRPRDPGAALVLRPFQDADGGPAHQHEVEADGGQAEPRGTERQQEHGHEELAALLDRAGHPQRRRPARRVVDEDFEAEADPERHDARADADPRQDPAVRHPVDPGEPCDHEDPPGQEGQVADDGDPRPPGRAGGAAQDGGQDGEHLAQGHPPEPPLADEGEGGGRSGQHRWTDGGMGAARPRHAVPFGQPGQGAVAVPAGRVRRRGTRWCRPHPTRIGRRGRRHPSVSPPRRPGPRCARGAAGRRVRRARRCGRRTPPPGRPPCTGPR